MPDWLKVNLERVRQNIAQAAGKAGRKATDIKLIAVSKTVDIDIIKSAFSQGIINFGENRVQELTAKYDLLPQAKWHLIGHLQKNKVKYILDKVELIHSLDSLDLAREIDKRAVAQGRVMKALVQVNVAGEATKFGIGMSEVNDFMLALQHLSGLKIEGMMTIAPFVPDPEEVREVFRALKEKFDKIREMRIPNVEMKFLSMGMSNDYKVAIEEGANIIRVGSNIFGKRN